MVIFAGVFAPIGVATSGEMDLKTGYVDEMFIGPGSYIELPPSYYQDISDVPVVIKPYMSGVLPGDENPLYAGQCVNYVKYITGVNHSGNAGQWVQYINSNVPVITEEEGSIMVMNTGKFGHIAIAKYIDDTKVLMNGRNQGTVSGSELWMISDKWINIDDERILGYIVYKKPTHN